MINNMDSLSSDRNEKGGDAIEEIARAINSYIANDHLGHGENKSVQMVCREESGGLSQMNDQETEQINTCNKLTEKTESNTKRRQFKVRLSFCLGYSDQNTNPTNCEVVSNEPKKFLICRWSQILLMLIVFAYYCHAEFTIVFSFDPPQEVPCFYNWDGNKERYECVTNKTIVNKCCPLEQSFVSTNDLTCTYDNSVTPFTPFNGKMFSKLKQGQTLKDLQLKKVSDIEIIADQFNNKSPYTVLEEDSYLIEDGVLLTKDLIYHDSRSFCSDIIINSNNTVVVKFIHGPFRYFVGDTKDTLVWFCFAPLSVLALSTIIGLYVSQHQLLNLHGKMLISYLLSQIGFYLTTTIHKFPAKHSFFSYMFNYTLQFSILAQHCWMTAMSLDVWIAFSRPLRRPGKHKQYTFCLYSVCCWGCSALLCACTAAVGVVPHLSDSCPKPRFETACFFTRKRTADLFFNTPMSLALCFNLVMFLSTVVNIRFLHLVKGLQNQPATEGALLYLKLSLLMGINWFLVWVGFRVETMFVYLYVRSVISIQGVVLAVVLICNKRMWNIIRTVWS